MVAASENTTKAAHSNPEDFHAETPKIFMLQPVNAIAAT